MRRAYPPLAVTFLSGRNCDFSIGHRQELGDGIVSALRSGASVCWAAVSEPGYRLVGQFAGAIAGLPFCVAESVFTLGDLLAWCVLRDVTEYKRLDVGLCIDCRWLRQSG